MQIRLKCIDLQPLFERLKESAAVRIHGLKAAREAGYEKEKSILSLAEGLLTLQLPEIFFRAEV